MVLAKRHAPPHKDQLHAQRVLCTGMHPLLWADASNHPHLVSKLPSKKASEQAGGPHLSCRFCRTSVIFFIAFTVLCTSARSYFSGRLRRRSISKVASCRRGSMAGPRGR